MCVYMLGCVHFNWCACLFNKQQFLLFFIIRNYVTVICKICLQGISQNFHPLCSSLCLHYALIVAILSSNILFSECSIRIFHSKACLIFFSKSFHWKVGPGGTCFWCILTYRCSPKTLLVYQSITSGAAFRGPPVTTSSFVCGLEAI